MAMDTNVLYYGDNLDILRKYIPDNSIDLIYLDPPFNSKATYNVLFKEQTGEPSQAQITAFEDTWHWGLESEKALQEVFASSIAPSAVKDFMSVMPKFLGKKTDMSAYLTMMCIRLLELKRVLKNTGSIYLHCDPTASHYLKILMDAIFQPLYFQNEIVWRRTGTHGKSVRFAPIHDIVLFYTKSSKFTWTYLKKPYMKKHVEEYFIQDEHGWRTNYYGNVLTGSGLRKGESGQPWHGFDPSAKGRHWAIPSKILEGIEEDFSGLTQHEKLDRLYELGYIKIIEGQAWPIYERYLTPSDGQNIPDIWAYQPYTEGTVFGTDKGIDGDVRWLSPRDQERLGYQTQKPEALLERIIKASSNEGDVVLDPFCGCGTALVSAHKLNRRWIGIDITHLAISTMKWRLGKMFPNITYEVIGEPKDLGGAKELANQDKYQFQWWAISLIGGQPYGDKKKGADTGIDGYLYFMDEKNKVKKAIISVKSGHVTVSQVRDLIGVVKREKAEMGVFLTLEPITKPMEQEASLEGFYHSPLGKDYPKIQIFTIEQLLEGNKPDIPPWIAPVQSPLPSKKKEGKAVKML
jgi:DNA modification methylase